MQTCLRRIAIFGEQKNRRVMRSAHDRNYVLQQRTIGHPPRPNIEQRGRVGRKKRAKSICLFSTATPSEDSMIAFPFLEFEHGTGVLLLAPSETTHVIERRHSRIIVIGAAPITKNCRSAGPPRLRL
jgi:hypothetical protein